MKLVSASIIVLAAAVLLVGGAHSQRSDARDFLQFVGCVVGLIGLIGWLISFREKQE
jgi:hypothetical protein